MMLGKRSSRFTPIALPKSSRISDRASRCGLRMSWEPTLEGTECARSVPHLCRPSWASLLGIPPPPASRELFHGAVGSAAALGRGTKPP